jgi:hypothetical protein
MHPTSAHRLPGINPSTPKLFLVPRNAAPASAKPAAQRPVLSIPAFSRRNVAVASLCLALFWAAHLVLEHVFHI